MSEPISIETFVKRQYPRSADETVYELAELVHLNGNAPDLAGCRVVVTFYPKQTQAAPESA